MSRDEAIEHLGTIAKSGTAEFLARMTGDQKKDAQLIGQFGVGFYSSFIVADRVDVYSRRAGLEPAAGVHWESRGDGEFSVATVELPERGTRIVLHLKEGEQDFADDYRIRSLVRKYSDHIAFPVRMRAAEGRARTQADGRVRNGQSRAGAVDAAAHRGEGRGIQGVLSPHHARLHRSARLVARQGRRQEGIHQPAVRAGARAVRPVASRGRARPQAVRAARLHHGRRRAVPAAVPALREGRGRFGRPAAEHLARDAAAGSRPSTRCAPA